MNVSPVEASQLVQHKHLDLRIAENAFYQHELGLLEEVVWDRYTAILGLQLRHNPDAHKHWSHYRESYSRDFQIVVDRILECESLADSRAGGTAPDLS